MIGLTLLLFFGALGYLYFKLCLMVLRIFWRKTKYRIPIYIGILIFSIIPFGDVIFNRLYHQIILCKREDVGMKVYEKIHLPEEYYLKNGYLKDLLPSQKYLSEIANSSEKIENRYQYVETRSEDGVYPWTRYRKYFSGVFDVSASRYIGTYVEYQAIGGGWWFFLVNPIWRRLSYNGTDMEIGSNNGCVYSSPSVYGVRIFYEVFDGKNFSKN